MKVVALLFLTLSVSVQAWALKLSYYGETSIPHGAQLQKTTIGGLSGMSWANGVLYAVSDDKGRYGEPRFYEFSLTLKAGKVDLKPQKVQFVKGLPDKIEKQGGLDLEGLFRLSNGDLLLSSEGNSDSKPRIAPRVIRVSKEGVYKADLPLDDKFLPEITGQQKKGTQGNLAFESLTGFEGGRVVFTATESALLQDVKDGEEHLGDLVRIIRYEKIGDAYKATKEFAYQIDPYSKSEKGQEFFRGVSEMLPLSEDKMIVLERGIRIQGNGWTTPAALYLADLTEASDVSQMSSLSKSKIKSASKVKLLDLESDLIKERPGKGLQNYEALTWGPVLADGRKTLLVLSDNNFSKKETTELLVFAVEGE